jgi:hypothetical protein
MSSFVRFGSILALCVGGWLLGGGVVVQAGPPPGAAEAYLEGNRLYQEGDYAGAARAYERVLETGVTSPELEYNLANAHLKQDHLGLAILHYRRALKLDPTYENAALNIGFARSLTQDMKPEEMKSTPWSRVVRLRLGPGGAAMLLFVAFTMFCVVAAFRLRPLRGRPWATVLQGIVGGFTLLFVLALLFEWTQVEGRPEGVVVTDTVDVRTGPADTYTVSFRLHEGTEVEVVRQSSGWREIKVSDRLQGWAPAASVEPI